MDINSDAYLDEIELCKGAISGSDHSRYDFGVTLDNRIIGYAIVKMWNDEWELGFELDPNYWKKGYGYRIAKMLVDFSVTELNLNRLTAQCSSTNIGSNSILKNLGMKKIDSRRVNEFLTIDKYEMDLESVT